MYLDRRCGLPVSGTFHKHSRTRNTQTPVSQVSERAAALPRRCGAVESEVKPCTGSFASAAVWREAVQLRSAFEGRGGCFQSKSVSLCVSRLRLEGAERCRFSKCTSACVGREPPEQPWKRWWSVAALRLCIRTVVCRDA